MTDTLRQRPVHLRPLRRDDLELLLAWRSNPLVYEHFARQNEPLAWADHREWFESRPPEREDFIIEYRDRDVGLVHRSPDAWGVGIYVGEVSAWGQGIGTAALERALERFEADPPYRARIHEDNERSQRLFAGVGFEQVGQTGAMTEWRWSP